MGVRFAAIPMGHEFTSLVLALLQAGGHPPKLEPEVIEQIRSLEGEFAFETYMSLTCHNCPDVVQALNLMAVLNPRIATSRSTADSSRRSRSAPDHGGAMIFLNGQPFGSGRMEIGEILAKIDTGAAARDAKKLAAKKVFDVLIVGGGPAGAAAASTRRARASAPASLPNASAGRHSTPWASRISSRCWRPKDRNSRAALEAHARQYDVDIIGGQRVESLEPSATAGGVSTVTLANGAQLKGRTVVLSTGARWRNVNMPGEQEYRNKAWPTARTVTARSTRARRSR